MYAHISILFKSQSQKIYDGRSKRVGEENKYFQISFEENFVMIEGEYSTEYIRQDDIANIHCSHEKTDQKRARF